MTNANPLGYLVWFNVDQGVEVEHITFCQKLLMAGVVTDMPSAPKTSDVFKRACTRALAALGELDIDGYRILPEGTDNYSVWRKIIRNGEDEKTLAIIKFNKETEEVTTSDVDEDPNVAWLIKWVTDYCESHSTMLTDYSIREHIRGVVEKEFQAVRVKQGLYFVLDRFDDQLFAVEEVVNDLAAGPGIAMNTVAVPWTDKHVGMVSDAMLATVLADTAVLRNDLATIELSDGTISKDRFTNLDAEYNRLLNQYGLFKVVCCGEIEAVQNELDEAGHDLMTVMGRIRV